MNNWSEMAFDVLEHITSFLPMPDYHRFGAVCKNWALIAKQKRYSPSLQLPWLVLGEDKETKKREFYSLSEGKHYSIDIPKLYGRCIRGSSHGWLFAIDSKITCILINPFTQDFYELPPLPPYNDEGDVTTLLEKIPSDYIEGPRNYTFEEMQLLIVYKGILSHDPKVTSNFTAIILFGMRKLPAIWRPGDSTWTVVKSPKYAMKDVTYLNGNFYVISAMNILHVVDLGSDPKMIEIEPRIKLCVSSHKYLVNYKGYLLLLERFQEELGCRHYITEKFELLEPDIQGKELYLWDDIDGYAIFIGTNSPIIVDANQFPGCKKNAFYFTDLPCTYKGKCRDLGIFDYVTKTISTFYPSEIVHHPVAAPVWINPNPW